MAVFEANTICRLCLRVVENVNILDNEDHKAFVESIINLKHSDYVLPEDIYVCYICYALITKSFTFAHTVWNAQDIICDILQNADIITKPILRSIDRISNGLNPITLTRVVVCEYKFKYESCTEGDTSSDNEEVDLSKSDSKQMWQCKKKRNKQHPSSSSDESEKTEKCNLEEVEVEISNIQQEDIQIGCNLDEAEVEISNIQEEEIQIGDVQIESSDPNTKDVIEIRSDEEKPEEEEVTKKTKVANKKRPCPPKPKDGTTPKKKVKRKKSDEEYEPDSTSHSEDSDHDLYDDEGKRMKVPKRVYPMKCAHCDFIVEEARHHYHHYQCMHPHFEYPYKKNRIYACSICGKVFAKWDIAKHEANHVVRKLKCRFCPKVFSNKLKRYRHMACVHTKRKLICDYCSKSFKTRNDIIRHIRIHIGSKPFKCHICGDGFAHSGNRLSHIRSKHQNYGYVPKKKQEKSQKVRRSNKRYSSDTEMSSNEVTKRKTKTKKLRKSKNQSAGDDVRPKKKRVKQVHNKNNGDSNDIASASETDSKTIRRRRPKRCAVIQNTNHENAETDSDDEVLAVIKTKKSVSSK